MILGIALLIAAMVSRFFLSPLWYFLVAEALTVVFVTLRKRFEYPVIVFSTVALLVAEAVAIFFNIGSAGHLFGTIVGTITALLGFAEERSKERFIQSLGLEGKEYRKQVKSFLYTFGEVERIEKIRMTQCYAILFKRKLHLLIETFQGGKVPVELKMKDIVETGVHQAISENPLYYPRLRDLFLPIKNFRTIGKPKEKDYFLVIRTGDGIWTFFEEPDKLLEFREEIEKARNSS
ncbi:MULTISPECIES: hypothetical protein [Kosmotoga]|uniref:Uncharacterized protein n=1 Tax=Kosmotoga olearia (strain ATCC BAA-1733 / DSM 21960 / TBF 19.5.1) TaxID=521045 RepID=C5CIQ1_KOSOT|nr:MULTISPECIES: hypothetical protein [Kosmotoga]ACR80834.1 hypothetical protein Kole_2157 [Kosmotoga olearia TBF 19.5.1]MDI3524545.1 hypothetical protein [Kosmotoga sp.]MDK2952682.1 hypothetical protein [Kosmotoga sp.]